MTRRDEHRELRTILLLLALAVGLLVAGAVVCLTLVCPRLAEPLVVGAAVLTCLTTLGRTVVKAARGRN